MQAKSNCRKNMQKKEIINAQKMQMQKRNAKHKEINKHISCKFKNANAENAFGHPLDSHLGGRARYAVLVVWLSCLQVLEFASHAICARMGFSSVWVSVPASTLEWAQRFSGKSWWLAQPPSPSPKRCFSGKWGPISRGMTYRGPICFAICFLLLLFFFGFCFSFCFLHQFFAISYKKYPALEVPNSDRGASLLAGHLSTWQAWASTLRVLLRLHGFTSDLPFQV